MSLYRKYRPKVFADVAGQEHIVTTLEQAVKQDKLAHAYLFAGTRGTGKTSIARILAKELLTKGIENEKIREQILEAIDEGNLVDLIEIDAASNRGIDDIRSLLEKIQFSPVIAKAKVYIIDEVHMLTREAFNALLKTLEEPPPYAFFLLATTELHKIPATIQSRCQRFLFRHIREEDTIRRLQYIVDQEHITIDRAALRAIAHHAQGSLRDAISLLDQLRSLESIELTDVKQRIGETGHEYVEQILEALRNRDAQAVIEISQRMEGMAVPLENFVRLLLGELHTQLRGAVEAKQDTSELLRALSRLLETIRDLRIAPVPGLVFESALLELCQKTTIPAVSIPPPQATPPTSATHRTASPVIEKKEQNAMKEETNVVADIPAPITAPDVTLEKVEEFWPEILKDLEPASVRMSLKNGHLNALEGTTLRLSFTSAFHRDKVSTIEAARAIESALEKIFKKSLRIKCMLETEEDKPTVANAEAVNLAEAAAEIF